MSEPIHQEIDFTASPPRIYEALTDSKQFTSFSGGLPAEIEPQAGGAFRCFGGQITGRIIDLVPNRRIVQAWHVAMWPGGVYSIVNFELEKRSSGTRSFWTTLGLPPSIATIWMLNGHGCIGSP